MQFTSAELTILLRALKADTGTEPELTALISKIQKVDDKTKAAEALTARPYDEIDASQVKPGDEISYKDYWARKIVFATVTEKPQIDRNSKESDAINFNVRSPKGSILNACFGHGDTVRRYK